jgi:NADPH:quinone reductase-like Zn-dependent oxidoreductase
MKAVFKVSASGECKIVDSLFLTLPGKIKTVIESVYALADAGEVLQRMLGRRATGNIILKPWEET